MNRISKAALCSLATLAMATLAEGQVNRHTSFHVAGGVTVPVADLADFFRPGFQAMAGVGIRLGSMPVSLRVDAFYGQNGGDESIVGSNVKAEFVGGMAGGQVGIGSARSAINPFLLGQVGVVHSRASSPGTGSHGETDFAFGAGGGTDFRLGSHAVFVEGQFVSILTRGESNNYIVARLGIRFGGN
jgi:hypothetical protein